MDIAYIISQVLGWIATFFRAGGMLAKQPMTVKWLVSIGNLGWLLSGIFTQNIPLIVSNALCLIVMVYEVIKDQRTKKVAKSKKAGYNKRGNAKNINLKGGKQ